MHPYAMNDSGKNQFIYLENYIENLYGKMLQSNVIV